MKTQTFFVGVDGNQAVNSTTTKEQIKIVRDLECSLETEEGEKISWNDVDNPEEPRTLFQAILKDREMRVDNNIAMADRPLFCAITATGNKAVRLEFYEGHDSLSLVYDLRAKELHGKDIPAFLDHDPHAYDPVDFLEQAGIIETSRKLKTHSANCPWTFKSAECTYSGEQTSCDKSWDSCLTLGNTINYGGFVHMEEKEMPFVEVENNGTEIAHTNYFDTDHARRGYAYLSINAGAFRLMVPDILLSGIPEMKAAREVIISRGPWPEANKSDALEILFEDGSNNPYALHISSDQVDQMPLDTDRDRKGLPPRWVFTAWTRSGKQLELPCRYRLVLHIPCLEPWWR